MKRRHTPLLTTIFFLFAGCSGGTATPVFLTATLPPTSTPQQATQPPTIQPSPTATAEAVNITPVEGTTTTEVNVRAEPSTASASLGVIGIFTKTQIVGRDSSGSWYQILYEESAKGWVRTEYVQVNAGAEIPLVEVGSASGSAVGGMVTQKVNVRNGPGRDYESLGMLSPNDLISITGRDAGGEWIQIEFASAPDGRGWITAEYVQAAGIETAPLIGAATEESPAPPVGMPPAAAPQAAMQDGDSMQSPLATVVFSATGSRAIHVQGDVSAPDGDAEDWIKFKSSNGNVAIEVSCTGGVLRVEVWDNGNLMNSSACGTRFEVSATAGSDYLLRLPQDGDGHTNYILKMEVIP